MQAACKLSLRVAFPLKSYDAPGVLPRYEHRLFLGDQTSDCAWITARSANQLEAYVRGEAQQLGARELLVRQDLAAQVKPDQMKNCLTKINADSV